MFFAVLHFTLSVLHCVIYAILFPSLLATSTFAFLTGMYLEVSPIQSGGLTKLDYRKFWQCLPLWQKFGNGVSQLLFALQACSEKSKQVDYRAKIGQLYLLTILDQWITWWTCLVLLILDWWSTPQRCLFWFCTPVSSYCISVASLILFLWLYFLQLSYFCSFCLLFMGVFFAVTILLYTTYLLYLNVFFATGLGVF